MGNGITPTTRKRGDDEKRGASGEERGERRIHIMREMERTAEWRRMERMRKRLCGGRGVCW